MEIALNLDYFQGGRKGADGKISDHQQS